MVVMMGDPAAPRNAGPHGENDLSTVLDAAASIKDTDPFPWRGQTLEGTGSCVPPVNLVG
jgi:hypothetical protein